MMERTTAAKMSYSMVYSKDVEHALDTLLKGGLVLLPTDTVWSAAALSTFPEAIDLLKDLGGSPKGEDLELLVSSLEEMKRYAGHLHPRLETLLVYHVRPLSVLFEDPVGLPTNALRPDGQIAIRLVLDGFVRELIREAGAPLLVVPASGPGKEAPSNFGGISSEIIQKTHYVVKYRQGDRQSGELPVLVRLSDGEELDFLRE